MINILQRLKGAGITAKFILWFLFISVIPLGVTAHLSYSNYKKVLIEQEKKNLFTIASGKINQVEAYLREKKDNANALSSISEIVDIIRKFDEAEYGPFLTYHKKIFGYESLLLIDPDGNIVFSTNEKITSPKSLYEAALSKKSELANVFVNAAKSSNTEVSDFEYDPRTKKGAIFIAVPIFDGTALAGVIICGLTSAGIFELVRDWSSLGETGEIILASRVNGKAAFITPLRFDEGAAFKREISAGSPEGEVILKAIDGQEGSGAYADYRHKKALAVWRGIPAFRLGMVVKMDMDEIFASARGLRDSSLRISFFLLALVIILAVVIARSISGPIRELTRVAGMITDGNLSIRAGIKTGDEIEKLSGAFNIMTDSLVKATASVTEQKHLLEAANKELDSFVYTVSHDLKAPLRGIDALTGFIKEDYADKLDEKGRDYISRIRGGVNRMKEFIDDLLTLSRISRIKNPYEEVSIKELVKSAIEKVEFDINTHNVDLKAAENLPVIYCDRIKMAEVFLNLINNAIKFSSKNKSSPPKVEVGYNDRGEAHEFFVKDNGIGIDKKYHEEIFGMFKRLHDDKEYEGTGAGLGIVKKIIDDHYGSIWVQSELGKGSVFWFTIPKKIRDKKKIGEILVEEGKVSEEDVKRALKRQWM